MSSGGGDREAETGVPTPGPSSVRNAAVATSETPFPTVTSPKIATRTSSKRAIYPATTLSECATDNKSHLKALQNEEILLQHKLQEARKKVKPDISFGPLYWSNAATVSRVSLDLLNTQRKIAVFNFTKMQEEENEARKWWRTQEARRLLDAIRAATYEKQLYEQQAKRLEGMSPVKRGFQALFNTSILGINAKAGMGRRGRDQARFKKSLLEYYHAANYKPGKKKVENDLVFDTATGLTFPKQWVTAAHIVPFKLGPDLMKAYFREDSDDLMTPQNGLLLYMTVERALDDGAITIVPDIPLHPTPAEVELFHASSPKSYRWRVVDPESETLDELVAEAGYKDIPETLSVRDLDGKKLHFRNDARPRARYLYWLFCVAMLKRAWKMEYRTESTTVFKDQLGKGMWATLGRYLSEGFLVALAAELGHDTSAFSSSAEPDDVGVLGIAKMFQFRAGEGREDSGFAEGDEEELDD